jgi:predicted lactoylglutathione lyase
MKMSSISGVMCYVKDLDVTAEFYEKLGFRLKRDKAQLTAYVNWFWIIFRTEDTEDRAEADDAGYRANRGAGTYLYIKVEDIQAFYTGVQDLGLKPATEPTKKGAMIEFELRDPDGYNIVFFWKK